jgi:hypothetical protein
MGSTVTTASPVGARQVGIPFFLGLFFCPYIFVWFLLRSGYSVSARVLGFGWLAVLLVIISLAGRTPTQAVSGEGATALAPIDRHRQEKEAAAALARLIVPKAMKDPSSAEFGRISGRANGTACGYVNGKNSFGAMAGQRGFIMAGGKVEFEGTEAFVRHWNAICVDKLLSDPPEGAMGMKWGGRPSAALMPTMSPTEDGLALYRPKAAPEQLEGVAVSQADFRFQHGALYAADFYITGQARRDAIRSALVKRFGTPLSYDERINSYSWEWPKRHITVHMSYEQGAQQTMVTYAHGAH